MNCHAMWARQNAMGMAANEGGGWAVCFGYKGRIRYVSKFSGDCVMGHDPHYDKIDRYGYSSKRSVV